MEVVGTICQLGNETDDVMCRHVAHMWQMRNAYEIYVENLKDHLVSTEKPNLNLNFHLVQNKV